MIRIGIAAFVIITNSINLFAQGASAIRFSKDTVGENGFYGQYSRDSVLLRNVSSNSITIDSISLYCDTSSYLRMGNANRSPRYAVSFKVNQLSDSFEYDPLGAPGLTFPNPVNPGAQAIPIIPGNSSLVIKDFVLTPCFFCPASEAALISQLPDTVLVHIVFKNKNPTIHDSLSLIGILDPLTNIKNSRKITPYSLKYAVRKGTVAYSLDGRRTDNQLITKPARVEIFKNDVHEKNRVGLSIH